MSSKISLFLTKDDEHWYLDTSQEVRVNGKLIGYKLTLEFSKKNAEIICNDDFDIVIEIHPQSEIYSVLFGQIKFNPKGGII